MAAARSPIAMSVNRMSAGSLTARDSKLLGWKASLAIFSSLAPPKIPAAKPAVATIVAGWSAPTAPSSAARADRALCPALTSFLTSKSFIAHSISNTAASKMFSMSGLRESLYSDSTRKVVTSQGPAAVGTMIVPNRAPVAIALG